MFDNKKVLSAVLAASMSTALIPAAAFAADSGAEGVTGEDAAIEVLAGGGSTSELATNASLQVLGGEEGEGSSVVAKIGDSEYKTLQEAIDAATSDSVVVLTNNVTLTEAIKVASDTTLVIDLNGFTISRDTNWAIRNEGNLTIQDSGNNGKITSQAAVNNCSGATLTLNSGTIESKQAQAITNNGILNISSGTVGGVSSSYGIINAGTVAVSGGEVQGVSYGIYSTGSGAKVNLTGGTVKSDRAVWAQNGATVEISGNSQVTATGASSYGVLVTGLNTKLTVVSGLINSDSTAVKSQTSAQATISGGTITGSISKTSDATFNIIGGTFSANPNSLVSGGYWAVNSNGVYTVETLSASDAVASVTSGESVTYYADFKKAIDSAQSGDTVLLNKDVVCDLTITIENKKITLDMNNHTFMQNGNNYRIFKITNKGGLNVTGTGTIIGGSGTFCLYGQAEDYDNGAEVENKATLTIGENVSVTNSKTAIRIESNSEAAYGVQVDVYGSVNGYEPIYVNGTIKATSGNVPIIKIHDGANITCSDYGIYLAGYAKTTIEDGATFVSDKNVIQIAAGELDINGGIFAGDATDKGIVESIEGSITAKSCVAVYIKQHTTNLPVKVTINDGTFNAAYALMEEVNQEAATKAPDSIDVQINGGIFASMLQGVAAVSAESTKESGDSVLSVAGGVFTADPSKYVTSDKKQTTKVSYSPSGATAIVGGLTVGNGQYVVSDKNPSYVVSASGYYTQSGTVTAPASGVATLNASLSVIPSSSDTTATGTTTTNNADGSTTSTTTNADGSTSQTTTSADGSTVSTTQKDANGNVVSTTETVTENFDDTTVVTETVTDAEGNKTVTETAQDEEKTVVSVTKPDGSQTMDVTSANGVTVAAASDSAGNVTKFDVTITEQAAATEGAVTLPVSVTSVGSVASDTFAISVNVEADSALVEIPLEFDGAAADDALQNVVAVIVDEAGAEQIVKICGVSEDGGLLLGLDGGQSQVKLIDNTKTFNDVTADWYQTEVSFVSSHEIMNGIGGVGATSFAPDVQLSRGMMAQILFNLDNASEGDVQSDLAFVDTEGTWYDSAATWARERAVTTGYGDGTFGGDDLITREQAVTMLYRYAGAQAGSAAVLNGFADAASVSAYAADAMAWATEVGIITGKVAEDGTVSVAAGDTATRAEIAVMIKRFCQYMVSAS